MMTADTIDAAVTAMYLKGFELNKRQAGIPSDAVGHIRQQEYKPRNILANMTPQAEISIKNCFLCWRFSPSDNILYMPQQPYDQSFLKRIVSFRGAVRFTKNPFPHSEFHCKFPSFQTPKTSHELSLEYNASSSFWEEYYHITTSCIRKHLRIYDIAIALREQRSSFVSNNAVNITFYIEDTLNNEKHSYHCGWEEPRIDVTHLGAIQP